MWFSDIVVDLQWLIDNHGKLGTPRGRAGETVYNPELKTEVLLYGDDQAIRHLRIMLHTDQYKIANACQDANIQRWLRALEVSSSLVTPKFSTSASLGKNAATLMIFLGEGDENTPALEITPEYGAGPVIDFEGAARLMVSWKPEFFTHLHYLSRFFNANLPPDVRWLNGYRVLEWHFCRGRVGLPKNQHYLNFLMEHGSSLDVHLGQGQDRKGLIEEVRALVAHAVLSRAVAPLDNRPETDLVLRTFSSLEALVTSVINEGTTSDVRFVPKST